MSGRVTSSGYIPPVSSNKARRSKLSDLCPIVVSKVYPGNLSREAKYSHLEALRYARQIPYWLYRGFANVDFHTRIRRARRPISIE